MGYTPAERSKARQNIRKVSLKVRINTCAASDETKLTKTGLGVYVSGPPPDTHGPHQFMIPYHPEPGNRADSSKLTLDVSEGSAPLLMSLYLFPKRKSAVIHHRHR